jgi:hypothetical protein
MVMRKTKMSNRPSIEIIRQAVETEGGKVQAERFLRAQGYEISESAIRRALARSEDVAPFVVDQASEIEIDDLIERRIKQFESKKKAYEHNRTIPVTVNIDGPIGLGFVGDPHVDDDGTNLKLLFEHADLLDGRNEGLFGVCLGDIWNNWQGRLAHLWGEQSTSAEEARALAREFLNRVRWMAVVWGNHDCLDTETEALTKRGWLRHDEITLDDEVLSFDVTTGSAVWMPIIQKIERPNTDEMITVQSQSVDLCVTPKHRILAQHKKGSTEWSYRTADELTSWMRLPLAGTSRNLDYPISDDLLSLIGWFVTDGGIHPTGYMELYQSKEPHVIRDLLGRLEIQYVERARDRNITEVCGKHLKKAPLTAYEFRLSLDDSRNLRALVPDRTRLPDFVHELSDRQFSVLLDAIVTGDGCWDGKDPAAKNCAIIYKCHEFLSSLQAACVSHGWRAYITTMREKDHRLNICRDTTWEGYRSKSVGRAPAADTVWCLSTPLTNFMIRRNGKAHFTGNCWGKSQDLLSAMITNPIGAQKSSRANLAIRFPNNRVLKISAAHRFPGSSQWSTVFGPSKRAQLEGSSNIYVGGDLHISGYTHGWHDGSQTMWHAVQVASYKQIDRYAEDLNLVDKSIYQCPVAIIDPYAKHEMNFVRWEFDPFEGAERLKWMRDRWAS